MQIVYDYHPIFPYKFLELKFPHHVKSKLKINKYIILESEYHEAHEFMYFLRENKIRHITTIRETQLLTDDIMFYILNISQFRYSSAISGYGVYLSEFFLTYTELKIYNQSFVFAIILNE